MSMTPDEARAIERPTIKIGKSYEFYCEVQQDYEPTEKRLRQYTGQHVTVLWTWTTEFGSSPVYKVRAADGREFTAHEEELNGWDRDLGQYFWPDATYGPEHDTTFLVNEH